MSRHCQLADDARASSFIPVLPGDLLMSEKDSLTPVRARRLYKYVHTHKHGEDTGLFWASPASMEGCTPADLAGRLNLDYDPEGGSMFEPEELGFSEIGFTDVPDITPLPIVGPGNPFELFQRIDYEKLEKQRHDLEAVISYLREDPSCSQLDSLKGLQNLLDDIQDLGTDTFT